MINWATDEHCRRCHQLLGGQMEPAGSEVSSKTLYICLAVFIAALVLPILVEKASPTTGDNLGFFLVMAALGLIMICKFLLLFDMFRVSILWGLTGILFAPVSTLVFIAMYWQRAKGKIITMFAALAYCVIMIAGVGLLLKPKVAQNTTPPPAAPLTRYLDQTPTPRPDFLPPVKNEPKKKGSR
jgi:hypothetical protein